MRKIFFFIAVLCCAGVVSAAQFDGLKTITSGGVERQYYLYVPNTLKANSPIFISCHGMNQDYQYQKTNQMPWLTLMADTASFVVVYPVGEAVSGSWGNMSSGWDMDGMKDVNFMLDIVSDVKANYNIDDTRVYMSGFSLGGAFAYYMAQKVPDKVAAVVSLSGYDVLGSSVSCSRPMPIFHLHGTGDDVMYYSQVEGYLKKWRELSNCYSTPVILNNLPCSCGAPSTLATYSECDCDVEIKLFTVPDIGHDWTGCYGSFVREIWNFCKQYNTSCGKIATAIDEVQGDDVQSTKVIRDGQLLIEFDGKTYNAQGVLMSE